MPGNYRKPTELTTEEFDALPMTDVEFFYRPGRKNHPEYFGFKLILFDEITLTSDQLKDSEKVTELDFLRMKYANGWPDKLSKRPDDPFYIGNVVKYSSTHVKHYQLSRGCKSIKKKDGTTETFAYYAVEVYLSDARHCKTFFLNRSWCEYIESQPLLKEMFVERKSNKEGEENYAKNPTSCLA